MENVKKFVEPGNIMDGWNLIYLVRIEKVKKIKEKIKEKKYGRIKDQ